MHLSKGMTVEIRRNVLALQIRGFIDSFLSLLITDSFFILSADQRGVISGGIPIPSPRVSARMLRYARRRAFGGVIAALEPN